jgi:lipoate-protein ligase A
LRAEPRRGPAWEIAISHALLRRVAAREVPPVVRIYRPTPTLAFGRLDQAAAGFPSAVREARSRAFEPVLRLAGGHAAAYGPGSVVCEEIVAADRAFEGVERRYDSFVARLRDVLGALGAEVAIGALPGEYCAGRHSLNVGGRTKVAGVAQRVVKGGALVSAAIVVADGDRLREVLTAVYGSLGVELDPRTVGALEDELPGASVDDLVPRLAAAFAGSGAPDTELVGSTATREIAAELLSRHAIAESDS